jgi:tetratricopeptide (TPR) repeat protein
MDHTLSIQSLSMSTPPVPSADDDRNSTSATGGLEGEQGEISPMAGGRWRPVRPEELLRKSAEPVERKPVEETPHVQLHRRQELEQHLRASPTDLDGYMELAAIYRSEDRPIEARRILQQAIQIFPEDEALLWEFEEATLARSRQQLREVTELAQRLDTLETEREFKRSQNDWACRRMDVCRARLKRDPSLVRLRVVLAEAMLDAGLYEPAIDELQAVLDNDELSPHAHLLRGRCLLALGRDIDAMSSLRAASMRRAVPAPLKTKVTALRLLCDAAERLGVELTLKKYRQYLESAENELAQHASPGSSQPLAHT